MNESKPDWSKAPKWANYFAIDMNGDEWWYESVPKLGGRAWFIDDGKCDLIDNVENRGWRDSLSSRPQPVIVGDTTGEPVGEVWEDGQPVFVKDGTLTNEEPSPNE